MTLERYITLKFLRMFLNVLAIITALSALLIAVENFRVVASKDAPPGAALKLTLFDLPDVMSQTLPLVLMLAALATFVGLSRTSEMVIVRASGVSALRMLVLPILSAVGIGVIATLLFNPIVAASSIRAEQYRNELSGGGMNVLSVSGGSLWLRQGSDQGQTVIEASHASAEGTMLTGVRLHRFDTDNHLTQRIEADTAVLSPDAWTLYNVRRWQLDIGPDESLGAPETLSQLKVPTNLTRAQILDSFAPPESLAIWALPGFIRQLERAGFSATRHRVFLQSELARPALFVAMVLIGAGFSLRPARFGQVGVMILMAIFAGFALYFFKDIAETLGNTGEIPVALAAWSAPAIAILLALGLLLHLEDG